MCPTEAETWNKYIDYDGCPDIIPTIESTNFDSDEDGIYDQNDLCPAEPETWNGYEDSDGCPDIVPEQ